VKIPAWFLLRHQLRVGDIIHVCIEEAEFDTRLGTDFRFTIPRREYEAIKEYWFKQPVLRVEVEVEERSEGETSQ
jgi:hypothetical protein